MKLEYFLVALLAPPIALTLLMYAMHWAFDKWGYPSAIRAFKLEHVMYSASGQGVASAVAIGISFKRLKT